LKNVSQKEGGHCHPWRDDDALLFGPLTVLDLKRDHDMTHIMKGHLTEVPLHIGGKCVDSSYKRRDEDEKSY
jgi:hypothetical protein